MKVLVAYNKHRNGGGADVVAGKTIDLLNTKAGLDVYSFTRDSGTLSGTTGNVRAMVSGCYSTEAVKAFSRTLDEFNPDVVHAHEVYPLISPWIFKICKIKKIPVVVTLHDYRLSCPVATHFRHGSNCYECASRGELRCIVHNCCDSVAKSCAYALRNYIGRKGRLFSDYVDLFLTPSSAARDIICQHTEISRDNLKVIGNPVPIKSGKPKFNYGNYVGYAGRFEQEKGFDMLVKVLERTGIPLKVAGNGNNYTGSMESTQDYIEFLGFLDAGAMSDFYHGARMIVVPSKCNETFGLVVAEALSCGTPAVVSDSGALSEVAGGGALVFPSGDEKQLSAAIQQLWHNEELCFKLASQGGEHVKQYAETAYVDKLIEIYHGVISPGLSEKDC